MLKDMMERVISSSRAVFKWIVENLEVIFFLFLFFTISVSFIWLLGTVVYPSQNNAVQRITILDGTGIAVDVLTPRKIFQEADPQALEFVYLTQEQQTIEQTIIVTVSTTSPYFFFVDPSNDQNTNSVRLQIWNKKPNPITVPIVHARKSPGLEGGKSVIHIDCEGSSQYSHAQIFSGCKRDRIEVGVESNFQAFIRNLSSEIGLTFILAFAGTLGSFFGLVLNQAEKRRKEAQEILEKCITAIRESRLDSAKEAYQALLSIKDAIPNAEFQEIATLLAIAQGDLLDKNQAKFEALPDNRLLEMAGAVISAADNPGEHQNWDTSAFCNLLERFPSDKIDSPKLYEKFNRVKSQYKNFPQSLQEFSWPKKPVAQEERRTGFCSNFIQENAESDQVNLFSDSNALFWSDHEGYQDLEKIGPGKFLDPVHLVIGNPGSGKTAFALALGEYIYNQRGKTFSAYLTGCLPREQIIKLILLRLFDFILKHPTYLQQLGHYQLSLLAVMLVTYLEKSYVLAELERHEDQKTWNWTQKATREEAIIWGKISIGQLHLLRISVEMTSDSIESKNFPDALASCIHSLGFETLRLVFDLPSEPDSSWYQDTVLAMAEHWRRVGWVLIVFTRQNPAPGVTWPLQKPYRLTWNDQELKDWALFRWRTINLNIPIEEFLGSDGLRILIENAHGNPRCFIHIWNHLMKLGEGGITADLIKRVCDEVKCF